MGEREAAMQYDGGTVRCRAKNVAQPREGPDVMTSIA